MEKRITQLLKEYGEEKKKEIKELLQNSNINASGKLIKSIDYDITKNADSIGINLSYIPYGQFVRDGRKPGKFPPIKSIEQWMKDRNIQARNLKTGRFIKRSVGAYLIARKIAEQGVKGFDFTGVWYEGITDLKNILTKELSVDIERDFAEFIKINLNK